MHGTTGPYHTHTHTATSAVKCSVPQAHSKQKQNTIKKTPIQCRSSYGMQFYSKYCYMNAHPPLVYYQYKPMNTHLPNCQYNPSPCNNPPPKRTEHVLPHSSRRVPLKCFNTCQHCNALLYHYIGLHLFAESSVSTQALKSSPHTKTTTLICNTPRPEQ